MAANDHVSPQARLQSAGSLRVPVEGGHQLHVERLRRRGEEPHAAIALLADLACDHRQALHADALGGQLALAGFDVYAADLRGHGRSWPRIGSGFACDFDTVIREDLPALAERIGRSAGELPLYWLAPGWAALWLLAAARRGLLSPARGLVLLSPGPVPGWHRRRGWSLLAGPLAALGGYLPARPWRLGHADEARGMIADAVRGLRQVHPGAAVLETLVTSGLTEAAPASGSPQLPPCLYLAETRHRHRDELIALLRAPGPHDARLQWLEQGAAAGAVATAVAEWSRESSERDVIT